MSMSPQEQPPPGTHCVVVDCSRPATVYMDVGEIVEGENGIAMCDAHAEHWRDGEG